MAGPADDLKDAVRKLGMADPMAQVGSAMARVGQTVEDGYATAKAKVRAMVHQTPQGTTRAEAPKRTSDVVLPAAKRLKRIEIEPSSNGGYVVRHRYQPAYGGTPKPETHTFSDYDSAHAHLEKVTK